MTNQNLLSRSNVGARECDTIVLKFMVRVYFSVAMQSMEKIEGYEPSLVFPSRALLYFLKSFFLYFMPMIVCIFLFYLTTDSTFPLQEFQPQRQDDGYLEVIGLTTGTLVSAT